MLAEKGAFVAIVILLAVLIGIVLYTTLRSRHKETSASDDAE